MGEKSQRFIFSDLFSVICTFAILLDKLFQFVHSLELCHPYMDKGLILLFLRMNAPVNDTIQKKAWVLQNVPYHCALWPSTWFTISLRSTLKKT